jgi:hypothetical protein
LKIGDWVRVSRIKGKFEKGYDENWSKEIYKIVSLDQHYPFTYKVVEYDDSPIEGSFYENELQKTKLEKFFLIDKVIKTKTVKGKKQAFVSWVGWDKKYNQWIDYKLVKDIEDK